MFTEALPIFNLIYYRKHALANLRVGVAVSKFADRLISDAGAEAYDFTLVGFGMGRSICFFLGQTTQAVIFPRRSELGQHGEENGKQAQAVDWN